MRKSGRSVLDRVNDSLPDFSHDYFSWKKNKYVQRMEIQLKMAHESLTPSLISFIEKTEQEYHLNIQTLPETVLDTETPLNTIP